MNKINVTFVLVVFLIYWIPLQDFVLAFAYSFNTPVWFLKFGLVFKDLLIIGLSFVLFLRVIQLPIIKLIDLWLILLVSLIFMYLFIGGAGYLGKFAELRAFILPLFLFLVIHLANFSRNQLIKIIMHLLYSGVIIAIFGLFERYLLPVSFWTDLIPIGKFSQDVKGMANLYYTSSGLPGNFYRLDIRRIVSVWGDPLYMGYFISIILTLSFVNVGKRGEFNFFSYLLITLLFSVLILGFARGAIISFLISIYISFLLFNKYKTFLALSLIALITVLLNFDYLYYRVAALSYEGSAIGHIESAIIGIAAIFDFPFGYGLGTAGTSSRALSGNQFGNTENGFLNLGVQTGLVSIFILLFVLYLIFKKAIHTYKFSNDSLEVKLAAASIILIINFIVSAVISPQIWAFKTAFYYWLIWGLFMSLIRKNRCYL